MKNIVQNILVILILVILTKCDNNDITSRDYPRLKTLPVTDINSKGAILNAEIIFRGDFDIIQYGFVWSELQSPNIENSDKVVYCKNITSKTFYNAVESTLKENVSYFVRAFVKTKDFTVYGEIVSFLSLGSGAPSMTSVVPTEVNFSDTIYIQGLNFSYVKEQNKIQFGATEGDIISVSDTLIKALLSDFSKTSTFNVEFSIQGNKSFSQETLKIKTPQIESISPTKISLGDTITIRGQNFTGNIKSNLVSVGNFNAEVITSSYDSVNAIVHYAKTPIEVSISNLSSLRSNTYSIDLINTNAIPTHP